MICPRPHCGGLLLLRLVVTVEGEVEEAVCHACGRRAGPARIRDPYGDYRVQFRTDVEAALEAMARSDGPSHLEHNHTLDIGWPPWLRDV